MLRPSMTVLGRASEKGPENPRPKPKLKSVTCYRCGEAGHFQSGCTKTVQCSICKSNNHCDSMHPKNKSKVVRQKGEGRSRNQQKEGGSGRSNRLTDFQKNEVWPM